VRSQKGIQFIHVEYKELFATVAKIYGKAKVQLGITGPFHMILAKDKTKVKERIAYESKWNSLASLNGPVANHVCIFNFKLFVGFEEASYNMILN